MEEDVLVTALTICLLAPDRKPVNLAIPKQEIRVHTPEQVAEVLQKEEEERFETLRQEGGDYLGSKIDTATGTVKETVNKEWLAVPKPTSNNRRPPPKFPIGVDEFGNTVWQEITAYTPDEVAEEERMIKLREKRNSEGNSFKG
ncbi:hypothetical protein HDU76_006805 [Blyttiomyces sp. JEL0837]|nr:hypothetical protein HDU76_006805 [Blyttiomyces sp. JEL0837]